MQTKKTVVKFVQFFLSNKVIRLFNKLIYLILFTAILPTFQFCKVENPPVIIDTVKTVIPEAFRMSAIPTGIGICSHNRKESLAVLQKMYDAGIRYIRYDLSWQSVEYTKGVYNFSEFDIAYSRATQIGIKLLFIFDYTSPYYDNNKSPYTEEGRTAFVNYAKAAVTHFQGKGIIWEIYNEPTMFWTFSDGTKCDPSMQTSVLKCLDLYSQLANAVASSIKADFPNEIIVAPGMAWCESKSQPYFDNTRLFLQNLYKSNVCNNLDAISLHPYRQLMPEYALYDYPAFKSDIENKLYNNSEKKPVVICTEWGYSSGWVGVGGNTYAEREKWKSKFIPRLILTNIMNNIPITILYDWMNDGTNQSNPEQQFGLVLPYDINSSNPTVTVLNSYNALKTLTSQLDGYIFSSRVNVGLSGVTGDYILSFTKGPDTRYVCWNYNGDANTVMIPITEGKEATVTSFDGKISNTFTAGANGLSCTLSDGPQYIVVKN